MDKVKVFLEKHVEWLTLGIGALFLFWMLYANVFNEPVTSTVGEKQLPPSQVDANIWTSPAGEPFKQIVDAKPPKPVFPVGPFDKPVPDMVVVSNIPAGSFPPSPVHDYGPVIVKNDGVEIDNPVTQLPTMPAVMTLYSSQGHSNVADPNPPAAGAGGGAVGGGGGSGAPAIDKEWVSISGEIPTSMIAQSLTAAKITGNLSLTEVLRVKLIRQEKDEDGNWSAGDTPIPVLAINTIPPLPAPDADPKAVADYRKYADTNGVNIMHPAFYQVLQGDVWYLPGTPSPNVIDVSLIDQKFDPTKYKNIDDVPEEYKDLWRKWKAAQIAAQQKANTPPPRTGGTGGGGSTGGGSTGGGSTGGRSGGRGRGVVADPDRPLKLADAGMPQQLIPGQQGGPAGTAGGTPEMGRAPGTPPASVDLSTLNAALPQGMFDPAKIPNILVWAHDDTVQAGKTYRYRLQYVVLNPVYNTNNVCKPQSLADVFTITSEPGPWSDPVVVEADANFYATSTSTGATDRSVNFDIFRWKNGYWQKQVVTARPGDMIGQPDKASGIDFTTGWTLLDIREEPSQSADENAILLVSENGTIIRRDVRTDKRNSEHLHLLEQTDVADQKLHPNAAQPPAGGPAGRTGPGPAGMSPAGQPGGANRGR